VDSVNRKVLVADDDKRILDIYKGIFMVDDSDQDGSSDNSPDLLSVDSILNMDSEMVWDVTMVEQGDLAVAAIAEAKEAGESYACALLDVRMPPGIDGIETARKIREIDPNIFIAMVTAYTDRLPEEVAKQLGGNFTMVRKPFYGKDLLNLVDNYSKVWSQQHSYVNMFL
jgi:CheY-like chemotaxis protein